MKISEKVKNKIISKLKKELSEAFVKDESTFVVKNVDFSDDITCNIEFANEVNTKFIFYNVYYDEKTGEILQRNFEVEL